MRVDSVSSCGVPLQVEPRSLVFGKVAQAALGIGDYLDVDAQDLNAILSQGLQAIVDEFEGDAPHPQARVLSLCQSMSLYVCISGVVSVGRCFALCLKGMRCGRPGSSG